MKPQAYTEFQPLEEVLVGRCYDKNFLDSLDVPFTKQTKSLMTHLIDETEEDFQTLIQTLESLGVTVRRPSIDAYIKGYGHYLGGGYLMNPRNDQIVIDNSIIMGQWHTSIGKGFAQALSHYKKCFLLDPVFREIDGSSIVRLGEHIIVDNNEFSNQPKHAKKLKKYFEPLGYKIIYTKTHDFKFKNKLSHADAVFAILKPGLILHSTDTDSNYSENIFSGWDYIKVKPEDQMKRSLNFQTFLTQKKGYQETCSYAFEDKKYNDEEWFNFLNNWFTSLMGYSKETYFDVNCLVVDESNVIFSGHNPTVFKELEKRQINPIVCPFRHRLFWDGGTHCITLDLKRRGSRERYL